MNLRSFHYKSTCGIVLSVFLYTDSNTHTCTHVYVFASQPLSCFVYLWFDKIPSKLFISNLTGLTSHLSLTHTQWIMVFITLFLTWHLGNRLRVFTFSAPKWNVGWQGIMFFKFFISLPQESIFYYLHGLPLFLG